MYMYFPFVLTNRGTLRTHPHRDNTTPNNPHCYDNSNDNDIM